MSCEMLVRTLPEVQKICWDLVVCDEAHKMKNSMIKTSSSLGQQACRRKLLLTGTPVQNDLGEYFSLVDVSCPGLLGTRAKFKEVETMVELGRHPEASQEQQEEGGLAIERLGESTRQIIIRRTSDRKLVVRGSRGDRVGQFLARVWGMTVAGCGLVQGDDRGR